MRSQVQIEVGGFQTAMADLGLWSDGIIGGPEQTTVSRVTRADGPTIWRTSTNSGTVEQG